MPAFPLADTLAFREIDPVRNTKMSTKFRIGMEYGLLCILLILQAIFSIDRKLIGCYLQFKAVFNKITQAPTI
jgi:hypothetical protein